MEMEALKKKEEAKEEVIDNLPWTGLAATMFLVNPILAIPAFFGLFWMADGDAVSTYLAGKKLENQANILKKAYHCE
ncbi:MAG: hypothetical protein M1536_06715 [Firmicutes bacterium]|nr:hypothetical protein [Bacillota bacterium]